MGIFRAAGFGLFLLIVSAMMPTVFVGFQETLTTFFDALQSVLQVANSLESISTVR